MSESQLLQFLRDAGSKPYRELVEYHVRRQSAEQLQAAVLGEASLLPEALRPSVMAYIDWVNDKFAYAKFVWDSMTCDEMFETLMMNAHNALPIQDRIKSKEEALRTENQELAFQLFQIATLSFAYSASLQWKQRLFMGIKKGLFF